MTSPRLRTGADALGRALALPFGLAGAVRRAKPLHPRGQVVRARLLRTGAERATGVAWLDEPGEHDAVVRFSRSVGLPPLLPDVLGLSLRFVDSDGPHDLLLASSGTSMGARNLIVPRWSRQAGAYGSVFTYSGPDGPLVIGAVAEPSSRFGLRVAGLRGPWQHFGVLELERSPAGAPDQRLDLDAVQHPLPGLVMSPVLAALRAPSYAAARRGRPDDVEADAAGDLPQVPQNVWNATPSSGPGAA